MPAARRSAVHWIVLAILAALCVTGAPAAAQPPAPSAPTATSAPAAAPTPTLTVAPTSTAAPVTAIAPALPVPQPTPVAAPSILVLILGKDRAEALIEAWQQWGWPAVIGFILLSILIAVVEPWRERFKRWLDRRTGGQRHDVRAEVERERQKEEERKNLEAKERRKQMPSDLERYLDWLDTEYGLTQPLGITTEQVPLSLADVHVPLRVVERDAIEAYRRLMRGEERRVVPDETDGRYVFELLSDPDLIAARLAQAPRRGDTQPRVRDVPDTKPPLTTTRLLLLGDAGSGKTTTLRYAALRLAEAYRQQQPALLAEPDAGLRLHLRQAPLPIYVRLTLFAATIPVDLGELPVQERQRYIGAPPDLFLNWLDREAAKHEIPEGTLSSVIKQNDGGVLLLLDGLDEAGDDQRRVYLAQVIDNLASRYNRQRYVVASRTAAFRGNVYLPLFLERHLSPLDADEAQALIRKWFEAVYARLAAIGRRRQDAAADQAAQLWEAIQRNERLFEMATNPLLLTVMALLQFNNVRLPDQRAKLYEKLIELLLDLWRKQNVASDTLTMSVAQLASEQRRLEALALAMQQQPRQVREVSLRQAQEWLSPLYVERLQIDREAADERVRDLLHRLAVDSGIIQRRDDLYSFSHYTFQEYLAARALDSLDNRNGAPDSVTFLLERSDDPRWRETLLLAAGVWSNGQQLPKTERLLCGLLAKSTPEHLLLAADVLADIGVVEELTPLRSTIVTRLRALAALTDDWRTAAHPDPVLRNRAATVLDRLDADHDRPGLDLTRADYWAARIEPGVFSMGDDHGKWDDEKPQFTYRIHRPYALARFPVTNRQYLLFLEALAGRGAPAAVAAANRLQELMKRHGQTRDDFRSPFWPGARYRAGEGNYPVVGVTWYAATAFAWWVDAWLHDIGVLAEDEAVRLPTEAEWERAAAYPPVLPGGDPRAGRREYPWGDDWEDATGTATGIMASIRANTSQSKIGSPSVVGIFPHGAAACGAQDMAGNVLEWCSTPYLPYPFKEEVAVESLYTTEGRVSRLYVMRGGAFWLDRAYVRCAYRRALPPDLAGDDRGIRLARVFSAGPA